MEAARSGETSFWRSASAGSPVPIERRRDDFAARGFRRLRRRPPSEVLPLLLLRGLVVAASVLWLALAPAGSDYPTLVAGTLIALGLYGIALFALLWLRVDTAVRWNGPILCVDLAFALTIIALTGGAESVFFLALYLIAALQAYYYGTRHGVTVALAATLLYVVVIWPTRDAAHWADYTLRAGMLFLTAIGLGVLGRVEREERHAIVALNDELRSRNQFVRDVLTSMRDGIVVLDDRGRIADWNRAMEQRYGIPTGEVLGRPFFELAPNFVREGLAAAVDRLYAGTDEEFAIERLEHDSLRVGRVVLNVKGDVIRGADGAVRGVTLFIEDVSERVALEQSLRESERLASLGSFAAGLAHEVNNPIGVITSRSELMLEDADREGWPAAAREDLQVIRAHAHRVARITQGLLSFARHRPGDKVPVDLNRIVEDALLLVGEPLEREGIALRLEIAPDLPGIVGDPTLLGQVLVNLLTNARDAMPDGGEITVRTEPDLTLSGAVRLLVRDTGVGIPDEQLGRIFEPFFTTKPAGTGLGLAMCYGIVREHGGLIGVESRPGEGTTVVVTLPGAGPGELQGRT